MAGWACNAPLWQRAVGVTLAILVIFASAGSALITSTALEAAVTVGFLLAFSSALGFWVARKKRLALEKRLAFLTDHDPLTGLMNRAYWLKGLRDALSRMLPGQPVLAVLVLELSGIRNANESLGTAAGDYLLKVSGDRLQHAAGPGSLIARFGSNQFGVVAAPLADPIEVSKLVKSIIFEVSQPAVFRGASLQVDSNVGIAMTPADGDDPVRLVEAAETALASARGAGRNTYRLYDAAFEKIASHQRSLERFAGEALALNALDVHFQPIVSLEDGRLTGFEALLRIDHPELGPLSPAEFVAAAERSGDIDRIGAWCIETSCRMAKQWPRNLTISVNLSPVQFNSGRLVANLRRILEDTGLPAYRLELEITEGIMLGEAEFVLTQLKTLQDMGVRVALDDFGTGYSSLSYLWKYPFSRIKIDRSFVDQLETSTAAQGIVKTIVLLGQSIGLPLTAEGIETAGQLEYLRSVGCNQAQGYLFSRPVPAVDLAAIILKDYSALLPVKRKKATGRSNASMKVA